MADPRQSDATRAAYPAGQVQRRDRDCAHIAETATSVEFVARLEVAALAALAAVGPAPGREMVFG